MLQSSGLYMQTIRVEELTKPLRAFSILLRFLLVLIPQYASACLYPSKCPGAKNDHGYGLLNVVAKVEECMQR